MKSFQVNNSGYVNFVTYGLSLIVLSAIWLLLQKSLFSGGRIGLIPIFISIVLGLLGFYFYMNSPKKLTIDQNFVTIIKNIGKVEIPIKSITKISTLDKKRMSLVQLNLGYFGFQGKGIGGSHLYVKDRKQMVKLETTEGNYVLSCKDRDRFVEALET